MRYDSGALVKRIRRRAFLPPAGGGFTDVDLLEMVDEALDAYLVPLLLRTREEWLNAPATVTLVAGTAEYPIPSAAIGGKTRMVRLLDVRTGGVLPPLPRLELEHASRYLYERPGQPVGFVLDGNRVRLLPTPDAAAAAGYQLRLVYHRQPSQLCVLTESRVVATASATSVSLTTIPGATFSPGAVVDLVGGTPPFEVLTPTSGLSVLSTSTNTVNFSSPGGASFNLSSIPVGSYLCLVGTSPIPQVPAVTHALVALYVAEGILKASDLNAAKACADERQRAEAGALAAVSPRTEGNPRRLTNGMAKWRGNYY